jgi:hypothetical protein
VKVKNVFLHIYKYMCIYIYIYKLKEEKKQSLILIENKFTIQVIWSSLYKYRKTLFTFPRARLCIDFRASSICYLIHF